MHHRGGTLPRRRLRSTSALLLAAFTINGCGPNWQPVNVAQPRTFDKGTVLEFHAREQLVRLHGVKFDRDSLSGIPWLDHLSCDSCRVHYALADIAQLRTGNPGAGAWNLMIPIAAFMGLVIGLAIAFSGYRD